MPVQLDLSRYVELFLTEGREHVAAYDAAIAALCEDAPGPHGGGVAEPVAAAFRAVHTLKGMAGAMGYARVESAAHALETSLESLREGAVPTRALLAHLAAEGDRLGAEVEAAGHAPGHAPGIAPGIAAGAGHGGAASPALRSRFVRVDAMRLDALLDAAGELEIARARVAREATRTGTTEALDVALGALRQVASRLRDEVLSVRTVPVAQVFERFPRLVRETARELGKEVELVLRGTELELDRSLLDRVGDPLLHLLRNALDHGIESPAARAAAGKPARAVLTLAAERDGGSVVLRLSDDGAGVDRARVLERARAAALVAPDVASLDDAALLALLARPGFSTADHVSAVSGRGVGFDVVDATVRSLGGTLELRTVAGEGTTVTMRLPTSLAVIGALIARVAEQTVAIPVRQVTETFEVGADAADRGFALRHGVAFPIVPLAPAFAAGRSGCARARRAVGVESGVARAALVVDELLGQQEVVVKRFDPPRGVALPFSGAAILADGAPVLILDVQRFL